MSARKHHVELSAEQRSHVEKIARSNKASMRERVRARILLAVDETQPGGGQNDADATRTAGNCTVTVAYVRQRFACAGMDAALHHREQARRKARKLDGQAEAHLVALVCGARRLPGASAGACICSPTRWWRQAFAVQGQCGVCGRDGGRVGSLSPALRSRPAAGLLGRGRQAVARRGARAFTHATRPARPRPPSEGSSRGDG